MSALAPISAKLQLQRSDERANTGHPTLRPKNA